MSNETILQKMYELLRYSVPVLNSFPKSQKYVLADRIQNQLSDLLELYITAYYAPPKHKISLLHKANVKLEILRHYFRLAYDLSIYSSRKYQDFAIRLNEIGRMTGGWIKSLQKN